MELTVAHNTKYSLVLKGFATAKLTLQVPNFDSSDLYKLIYV
jgi:hypothetical protein